MKNMAQVAVVKYESCLSRAFFHPAGAYLQLYERYSIFVRALFTAEHRKQSVIFKPKQCSSLNLRMK